MFCVFKYAPLKGNSPAHERLLKINSPTSSPKAAPAFHSAIRRRTYGSESKHAVFSLTTVPSRPLPAGGSSASCRRRRSLFSRNAWHLSKACSCERLVWTRGCAGWPTPFSMRWPASRLNWHGFAIQCRRSGSFSKICADRAAFGFPTLVFGASRWPFMNSVTSSGLEWKPRAGRTRRATLCRGRSNPCSVRSVRSTAWRGELHVHERFADLFATYTAGPAYACTCILLRLDAARAAESEWSHPSPNERAYWVLKVLERVVADSAGPLGRYGDIVEQLREAWSGMCQAANSSLITAEETKTVDVWFARLFPLIESCAGLAKYQGWLAVQRLAGVLNPDRSPAPVPALQPEEGIRDVLNAAWLCRLDYFADRFAVEKIGERATGLCTAAAKAGPH